jgi:hypothetical protein
MPAAPKHRARLHEHRSSATFTYDANGNRTSGSYTTGTGNRLTSDGTWTYTYDDGT